MEELKRQIEDVKLWIIKLLIIAICFITLSFTFAICYMTYYSYNYEYTVPNIENTNTNSVGGN